MSNITPESIMSDLRYLQLLSRSFPTIADASTEIINLEAIFFIQPVPPVFFGNKQKTYQRPTTIFS